MSLEVQESHIKLTISSSLDYLVSLCLYIAPSTQLLSDITCPWFIQHGYDVEADVGIQYLSCSCVRVSVLAVQAWRLSMDKDGSNSFSTASLRALKSWDKSFDPLKSHSRGCNWHEFQEVGRLRMRMSMRLFLCYFDFARQPSWSAFMATSLACGWRWMRTSAAQFL